MLPLLFDRKSQALAVIPPTPTGERHSAIALTAEVDYLSIAEANFDLEVAQWHGYAWVRFNTLPADGEQMFVVGQFDGNAANSSWVTGIYNEGGDIKFILLVCHDDGAHQYTILPADNWFAANGNVQAGVWYFMDFWVDFTNILAGIRIDASAGVADTMSPAGVFPCASSVDVRAFWWAGPSGGGIVAVDGRIGGMAFRRGSKWTNAEISYLYNGGCQLLFSEIDTGLFPNILTDLYALWDMQEDWGQTRDNAEGTSARDFLNNGVVGQSCGTCFICTSSLLTGIYGAYHADEASGVLVDSSGNGRDFADTNTVGVMSGQFSGARAFVNANLEEFFRVHEANQAWTTGLSAAFWFRPENFLTQQSLFQKYSLASGKFQLQMLVTSGFLRFNFGTPVINAVLSVAPTLLAWNHIAFSYDGAGAANADRFKLYLDGVLQSLTFTGTVPATLAVSVARLRIGGANTLDNYQGGIDEMIILSRPMTASEVLQHKSSVFPWST